MKLKRLNAPKLWPILRKENKYITNYISGKYNKNLSIPLKVILNSLFNLSFNKDLEVLINNKKVNNLNKANLGLFDIFRIKEENYILLLSKTRFIVEKINFSNLFIKKVVNKKVLKNNNFQINFLDGSNKIMNEENLKIGDTLLFEGNKLISISTLKEDSKVYLISGKYQSDIKTVEKVEKNIIYFKEGGNSLLNKIIILPIEYYNKIWKK